MNSETSIEGFDEWFHHKQNFLIFNQHLTVQFHYEDGNSIYLNTPWHDALDMLLGEDDSISHKIILACTLL